MALGTSLNLITHNVTWSSVQTSFRAKPAIVDGFEWFFCSVQGGGGGGVGGGFDFRTKLLPLTPLKLGRVTGLSVTRQPDSIEDDLCVHLPRGHMVIG